ncbi:sensor histidine kinase [Salidesulfovibrio onnuriiensis]|uniref:sensor histidine kinase n=1 Tax=Salidesulfovibrio onnuriiensis TaxID=2583823 RepID=UPI00202AC97E|nr:HAMP domain-containing sensor histidine kinase [Salidesulfovibrio onnuriiensis]
MRLIPKMSISAKMLAWALAITTIFCATTAYLVYQIRSESVLTREIVSTRYEIGVAVQQMIERLESVQSNIARFKVLGGDATSAQFIVDDLTRFSDILRETLDRHPKYTQQWLPLTGEFTISLTVDDDPGHAFAADATIQNWMAILAGTRAENQQAITHGLAQLRKSNLHAYQVGFYGLIVCLLLAVPGSALLTWRLNIHLERIRTGIRTLGSGEIPAPVRVRSGDELEDLATSFNDMAAGLRREERMRSDFISMLSHEIRTPLTSIRESVDMIADGVFGEVNEKQERFLRIAEKETERLAELLRRLMTVSRLESESLELRPESMDCSDLVLTTMERLESAALAKHIQLKARVPEDPAPCRADSEHLRQVLLNLGGNAIKFSPEHSEVTFSLDRDENGYIFSVDDQGPGVPESERELVFQKYYRAEDVRTDKDGAGLGLAISRKIVEAHKGRMWVDCGTEGGCGFRFFIPAGS